MGYRIFCVTHVAYWNCSCEVVRGSLLLLAPLAAAVAGGIRIATALFHTKCVSIPPELFAIGCQSAVELSGQLVSLTLVGRGCREEWGWEALNGRYGMLDVICLHII